MLYSLLIAALFMLIIIVLALKYYNNKLYHQLVLEHDKNLQLGNMVSECKSELSLTNDQMKIEIGERKKRFEAYTQIKKELVERNNNRLNFLRNVSHEIRTPLNAINGMLTLIEGTELSKEQKEYLDISRYHTKELLTLLNDINDFSDIKRGIEEKISCLSFSLKETLFYLHKHLNHKAVKKGITFTYHISEQIPQLMCGDPIKLRKILFNLTDNAIKFTDTGEVSISVHSVMQKSERFTLEFQIKDTGAGIPPDIENLLFQAVFCQADTSINRKCSGLGLGLAVAKELVTLMGGSISFQSKENEGTTFTFTANFEKCIVKDNQKECNEAINSPYKSFSFSDLNILLIDEQQIRIKIIHKILTEIGCHVNIAANIEQALSNFDSKTYQALIITFVERNIFDNTLNQQFSNSHLANTPIIALTKYLLSDKEKQQLSKTNISACLEVPINARDLINCIERICRSSVITQHKKTDIDDLYQMINKEAALAQLGDENLFNEVLQVFIKDLPTQMNAIKKALEANDFEQISMHALSLKSSASTIMASEIKQIAFDLGVAGNENNSDKINRLILNLEETYNKLKRSYHSVHDG